MRSRLLVLIFIIVLLASACIRVDLKVDVNDDGSGEVSGITAINVEAIEELAGALGEGGDICSEFTSDSGLNEDELDEAKPYNKDGFCGVEFRDSFENGELDNGAAEGAILRREGEGWYFELPLADGAGGDFGDLEEFEGFPGVDQLFGEASYKVRVRLPGRQVEHNGDEIDGDGFVVWDIDITAPPERLFLRTEPGDPISGDSGGGSGLIIGIIVLALLALGAAAFFLMRKKDDAVPEGLAPAMAGAPMGTTPTGHGADWSSPETPPVGADSWSAPAASTADLAPLPPVQDFAAPATDQTPVADATVELNPEPAVIASPTPEQATGQSVWDATRRMYVQWDPVANTWLDFDDDTQTWNQRP